jgi:hypothetical protein
MAQQKKSAMASVKIEKNTEKRTDSQCNQRDLSRVYCNPWPKILDVPEKNKHPTAQWASRLVPLKVIQAFIFVAGRRLKHNFHKLYLFFGSSFNLHYPALKSIASQVWHFTNHDDAICILAS